MNLAPNEPSAAPWRVLPIGDFAPLVYDDKAIGNGRPWILRVDGRSGSGKSTIADALHRSIPNSAIVHTDDVAWHHSFFDWEELLLKGILQPLHARKAVRYQPPGWQPHGRTCAIEIAAGLDLVIVEGVGANRTEIRPWIDASVWVQSDFDEAERRGIARDGGTEEAKQFWQEWMTQEILFLEQHRPWESATAVVNGTPTEPYDRRNEVMVSAQTNF